MFNFFSKIICNFTEHHHKTKENQIYKFDICKNNKITFHYCPRCHRNYIYCKDSVYEKIFTKKKYEGIHLIIDKWLQKNTDDISELKNELEGFFTK